MQSQSLSTPKVTKIDKYTVEEQFPQSGEGQVYLCSAQNNLYAVKIPKNIKNVSTEKFLKESVFIKALTHSHIIQCIEYKSLTDILYSNKSQKKSPMTVLEYAWQGDLFDFNIKRAYSEQICRTIMGQIINAMIYLHKEKKIMHLDMKTQNILVMKDFSFKITDFGHARTYEELKDMKQEFKYGTDFFLPPEYDEGFNMFNGQKVDVFNCGIILFRLLTSNLPVKKTTVVRKDDFYCLLKKCKYESFWHNVYQRYPNVQLSASVRRLILCMLEPTPSKRYTFEQIVAHDWFVETKPASVETVKQEFLKQKTRLLNDPSTKKLKQRIEDIKRFYEDIQNQHNIIHNSQQGQARGQKQEAILKFYQDLKCDNKLFKDIPHIKLHEVNYYNYKPEFLVTYLKNELRKLEEKKHVLLDTQVYTLHKLIQYNLQIVDSEKGIFSISCMYQFPNSLNDLQICQSQQDQCDKLSNICMNKTQSQGEDLVEEEIKIFGQVVETDGLFGINWNIVQNAIDDPRVKQTIYQLRNILLDLQLEQQ